MAGRPRGGIVVAMDGLYALKPWYADRLAGVRRALARARVSPGTVSAAGVLAAAGAAAVIACAPAGPVAGVAAGVLLAVRLGAANLDGGLARDTGRCTPRGSLVNEASDRIADLLVLAAFAAVAPLWLVATAALAATLPSWVSLAGAAAGAPRLPGGPLGKTERCLVAALAAGTGLAVPALVVVAAGSALTAGRRAYRLWHLLDREPHDLPVPVPVATPAAVPVATPAAAPAAGDGRAAA